MKYFIGVFIFSFFCCLPCLAQFRADGCVIYEEPKRKLVYESIHLYSLKGMLEESLLIEHFYKKEGDSVSVYKNRNILTTFIAKNNLLQDDIYKEVDSAGTIRALDSFNVSEKGARKRYFLAYTAKNIRLSKTFFPDGSAQSVLYYSSTGADSLYREWYPGGIVKFLKHFKNESNLNFDHYPDSNTKPVENLEYYPNGVLAKKEKAYKNYSAEYRETGSLKRVSFDTLISHSIITCVKNYYTKKNIKSIQYFQEEQPCHTWAEYSETGALLSSIKKPAIRENVGTVGPGPPRIFVYVEQMAAYPEGTGAFQKYFEEKLSQISYPDSDFLSGKYSLFFEVTPSGKPEFIDLKGYQAQQLKTQFKSLIEKMSSWKPAKRNGRAISESFEIILKVK